MAVSRTIVQTAARYALSQLPSPPDGHCAEAMGAVLDYLAARRIAGHVRAYVAPNHPGGPHYTVVVDGVEYDTTVGYANWSRRLHVPRGKLYVVTEQSPHRRWPVLNGGDSGAT